MTNQYDTIIIGAGQNGPPPLPRGEGGRAAIKQSQLS